MAIKRSPKQKKKMDSVATAVFSTPKIKRSPKQADAYKKRMESVKPSSPMSQWEQKFKVKKTKVK